MSALGSRHVAFEVALEEAFPRYPLPSLSGMPSDGWRKHQVLELLKGRTWTDLVGERLISDEMDLSLSILMEFWSPEAFDYYVASHLKLAVLYLGCGNHQDFVRSVMEAFLLPPVSGLIEDIKEIDDELGPDATVEQCGARRIDFYRRITPAQRICIGQFLDLYLIQCCGRMTRRGAKLFEQNRDYWLHLWR